MICYNRYNTCKVIYKHFLQKALCLKLPVGIAQIRLKWHKPHFKAKSNVYVYMVNGTQNNRLTVSTQKSVFKNMHRFLS